MAEIYANIGLPDKYLLMRKQINIQEVVRASAHAPHTDMPACLIACSTYMHFSGRLQYNIFQYYYYLCSIRR